MNTGAIDSTGQPGQDSEGSDEIQFGADELRQQAEAASLTQLLRIHSTVVAGRELATTTALISAGQ